MTAFKKRLLSFVLILLIMLQSAPSLVLSEDYSSWNEVVSNVVDETWYSVSFTAGGETVQKLNVLSGSAVDEFPDAPKTDGALFLGWFDGDKEVKAGFVPKGDMTLEARYSSAAKPVDKLSGDTSIGYMQYEALGKASLPEGAEPTAQWVSPDSLGSIPLPVVKGPKKNETRVIAVLRLGVSDPYWELSGSMHATISLNSPIMLHKGEKLFIFEANELLHGKNGANSLGAQFDVDNDKLFGLRLPQARFADYIIVGAYDPDNLIEYTVTFVGPDGETILEATYAEDEVIGKLPEAPELKGSVFTGWQDQDGNTVTEETAVTSDMTVTAVYELYCPETTAFGSASGLSVYIEAPEGAVPENAEFVIVPVDGESIRSKLEKALGEVGDIAAVDMSFVDSEGSEIHPLKAVSVEFSFSGMEDSKIIKVAHIKDDGTVEVVYSGTPESVSTRKSGGSMKRVSFKADSFSVYAVFGDVHPEARLTVNFYGKDTSTEIATMYVKNSDELAQVTQILYDPGAGTLGNYEIFRGWVLGTVTHEGETPVMPTYTVETATDGTLKTIDDIRQWAAAFDAEGTSFITEGDVVNIRAAIYKAYTVTYLDSKGIALSADSILIMPNDTSAYYEYTISQSYDPPQDTVKFNGWELADETSQSHITSDTQQADNLYQKDDEIHITGDVVFKVNESVGHWIVFHENGKGADYNAPVFVERGNHTAAPDPAPERKGYIFGGWYEEVTGEADDHNYTQVVESTKFTFGDSIDDIGDRKLHLYAKWTPVTTAPYTIIFWGQRLGDNGKVTSEYEVLDSFVNNNGTVGQNIPYTSAENGVEDYAYRTGSGAFGQQSATLPNGDNDEKGVMGHYRGFSLTEASKNQQVEITPEGDAVLNLYYDRAEYNFRFYLYRTGSQNNTYDYANNSGSGSDLRATNNGLVTWHTNQNAHPSVTGYNLQSETVDGRTYYYFTITAHYGENIENDWPTYDKITGANGRNAVSFVMMVGTHLKPRATSSGTGTVKGVVSVLNWNILGATNNANGNYVVIRFPTSYNNWRYHIWLEAIDADHVPANANTYTYEGKLYYEEMVMSVRSSNLDEEAQNEPKYTGFDYQLRVGQNNQGVWEASNSITNTDENGNKCGTYWTTREDGETLYHLNYIYNRQQYRITYFDGNYLDGDGKTVENRSSQQLHQSDLIPQGKEIEEEYREYVPATQVAGYTFAGWYLDAGCTVEYPWSVMPVGGIEVYAKWQLIQYRVYLKSNVPEDEYFTWGSDDQGTCFRISYGETVSLPSGRDREGWEFLGWYTTPNFAPSSRFTSDYALTEANVTQTYDQNTEYTDTFNKYGNLIGPNFNKDKQENRTWIKKKLVLYAKWHEVLDGADGIQIVYDPILAGTGIEPPTGHNPPTDNTYYSDAAQAVAQAGSTADQVEGKDKYQFECWVVQKWNSSAWADTDVEVYPGDTFEVKKADAKEEAFTDPSNPNITKKYIIQLRAKYKPLEEPKPTHIYWFENDVGAGEWHTSIRADVNKKINEAVTIVAAPTRQGYSFVGWAKVPTSISGSELVANSDPATAKGKGATVGTGDLFLKWQDGKYWAKNSAGNWVQVSKVAADEVRPYDDLYAVWVKDFPITVQKNWDNTTGFEDKVPDTVTVEILQNEESMSPKAELTISKTGQTAWKATTSKEFHAFDASGNEYHYTIAEREIEGWKYESTTYPNSKAYVNHENCDGTVQVTNTRVNGSITLNKTISTETGTAALPTDTVSELVSGITFTVSGPNNASYGPYALSDFTLANGTYTLTPDNLAFVAPGQYTYSESDATNLLTDWGYGLDEDNSVVRTNITLEDGGNASGTIKNVYKRIVGDLIITKTVAVPEDGAPLPAAYPNGKFPYTVKLQHAKLGWLKGTGTNSDPYVFVANDSQAGTYDITSTSSTGTLTLDDIPTGTYTVYEQGTAEGDDAWIEDYLLTVAYSPANTAGTGAEIPVPKDTEGPVSVTITNTYTRYIGTLSVSKATVPASISQAFKFTVKSDGKYLYLDTATNKYGFRDTAYEFEVTSNGNPTVLVNIPVGTYTVEEVIDGETAGDQADVQVEGYRYDGTTYDASQSVEVKKTHTEQAPAEVAITNSYTKLVDVTVTKTFSGIAVADIPANFQIGYTITENGQQNISGTFTKTDADISDDGLTWTWEKEDVAVGAIFEAVESSYAVTGYKCNTASNDVTKSITVSETTNSISYTNVYELGSLTITKEASGLVGEDVVPPTTKFTVTGPNSYSSEFTYSQMTEGSYELTGLKLGQYSVAESGAEVEGYKLTTTVGQAVTLDADNMEGEIEVENVYSQTSLTLMKFVTGNLADPTKEFTFTVTLDKPVMAGYVLPTGVTITSSSATQTVFEVTLTHGASVTLANLPADAEVSVAETDATPYVTAFKRGETTADTTVTMKTQSQLSTGSVALNDLSEDPNANTFTFTNHYSVDIPTGVNLDYAPYLALLALCLLALTVMLMARKRKEEN
ncbi:MAG: InlB B-repeat-containing protein [Clostridiales bacterium]|nr:InlB B-repeat-containing protein [Clostridiales bacterium]